jgi:hypothetical protein
VEASNSHLTTICSDGSNVYIYKVTSRKKVLLDTINDEQSDDRVQCKVMTGYSAKINKQPCSLTA